MAEKLFNTRIALKYDSYENWMKSSLILKIGEVALCSIPTGTNANGVVLPPAVVAKVGDGTHTFAELSWLQAVASDVYAWAKAPEKPQYSATEISGLTDFISGEIQDSDTQYNIVKGDDDYTYKLMSRAKGTANFTTEVATISIPNPTTDISALKTLVGEASVASQIAAAITALNLDSTYEKKGAADAAKTALLGDAAEAYNTLGKLEDAVVAAQETADNCVTLTYLDNELRGYAPYNYVDQAKEEVVGSAEDTSSSNTVLGSKAYTKALYDDVDRRIKDLRDDVGDYSVIAQINGAIDQLDVDEVQTGMGEIIHSISETDGKISVSKRELTSADIPTITQAQVEGLEVALADKQDALAFMSDNYDAITNKVATRSDLESITNILINATRFIGVMTELPINANNGDICIIGSKEYIYVADENKWSELGDETHHALKGEIVDADIKADAAIAQSKIAGLTDALTLKANDADLAAIAKSGSTDDLVQGTMTMVFNCGSAFTVV